MIQTVWNKLGSPSRQDKIFPLSTEKEALYKKLKEEEDGKHLPTEKNSVGTGRYRCFFPSNKAGKRGFLIESNPTSLGLPRFISGARAGEPESGAGDQEQPAAPEREEAHGDGQTGERHSPAGLVEGKGLNTNPGGQCLMR